MQLRTSDVRLCMLQRSIKDWEKQMEKHAALMATRKRAQKAASRPTDDSERRVRQRRDSQAQTDADTGGAAERRMTKRLEAHEYARVQQLEYVELLDALRSCIVHYSDDERYAQARRALACAVYRMDYVCCDEFGEPNGDPVWDADFDDATDRVPLIRNCLQASLPRRAPLRQRPAIELWQIDWLLKYEDQGTGWDEVLAANSPPAGTTMAAVTGRDVVNFLQRERRKGLAEAAFARLICSVYSMARDAAATATIVCAMEILRGGVRLLALSIRKTGRYRHWRQRKRERPTHQRCVVVACVCVAVPSAACSIPTACQSNLNGLQCLKNVKCRMCRVVIAIFDITLVACTTSWYGILVIYMMVRPRTGCRVPG